MHHGAALPAGRTHHSCIPRAGIQALPDNVDPRVSAFVRYVDDTWISSQLWPASCWSAFQSSVRTNNDVEGWHNRLNRQTRAGKLDFYQLAATLHDEAQYVQVQAVLVSEGRLRRYQKRKYKDVQGKLNNYWQQYTDGNLSTSRLLRKSAYLIAPQE